jgi:hypothetical protein
MRLRLISLAVVFASAMIATKSSAQLRVTPTAVNVNTQGATTVFLTYGGLRDDQTSSEAVWCARLIPAAPDIGFRCDPATLWGQLPSRYDRSRVSGVSGYTDIMSIPPSIARRAYGSAKNGNGSTFFYVRRFVSSAGLPDEYVFVDCRLTGGGADVPLSLTDVTLAFTSETPVLFVHPGDKPPPLSAKITYTGTGQLVGRWEVVRPGEELPDNTDLLTEATLPEEDRGSQRRYTQLERFNVFLPPSGRFTLPGPDVSRLPADVEGSYLVLLRVEASDDGAGDSNLATVGAGTDIVRTGAVAGFPLPTLRYVVGAGESDLYESERRPALTLVMPQADTVLDGSSRIKFAWVEMPGASFHRLEIRRADGQPLHSAVVAHGAGVYVAPPWIAERAGGSAIRWRVIALDASGHERGASPWRRLELNTPRSATKQAK